jgi:hypothetical protein
MVVLKRETSVGVCCAVIALVVGFSPGRAYSAEKGKPLREREIVQLLTGDVPSSRIAELIRERGIDFEFNSESENKCRGAGATQELIDALKAASKPKAEPSPPQTVILNIQTEPGETQVYVDDEPKGLTSPEGRLRLPNLPPGDYKLRVSLDGYQSWQKEIHLSAGENPTVFVTLVQKPAEKPPAAPVDSLMNRFFRPGSAVATPSGIPIPNAKVDSVRFFESGFDTLPKNRRNYQSRFPLRSIRYVNWELNLVYPAVNSRIDFSVEAVWHGPNGNVVWQQTLQVYADSGWSSSSHVYGWGCQTPPCKDFQKGWYKVDLLVGSQVVASGTFEMY